MKLDDGARIAVVGGGPSGALTGIFLLELADRIGIELDVDLFEPRDFTREGKGGCNMCAGVVSESLVQTLAAEGVNLPRGVVQGGIDSYVLHTSGLQTVSIQTPAEQLRIATVFRGSGPEAFAEAAEWASFDRFLLDQARRMGARIVPRAVDSLDWDGEFPRASWKEDDATRRRSYDLLVGAVGVNGAVLNQFEQLGFGYKRPKRSQGFVGEVHLGRERVEALLGHAMHIFLLDIPGLKFAAIVPKADYATVCLLGEGVDLETVRRFFHSPEVQENFPGVFKDGDASFTCHCAPFVNTGPATQPFGNRVVLVGDCAVSRLYKNGIGSTYDAAKACAKTAIFEGVSGRDFEQHYWPAFAATNRDNRVGRIIFLATLLFQKIPLLRRGMVEMVKREKESPRADRLMSRVLWDTFTGSASYREILTHSLRPRFLWRLGKAILAGLFNRS